MKIGLILECTTDGPDWEVYSGWIKRILGYDAVVEQSSAVNKKILIREAGTRAQSLFAEGCTRVFIIWDLWPAWAAKGAPPNQNNDEVGLKASLTAAGVTNPCVYLLCVNRMLETLLIVDGAALNKVLQLPKQKQKPGNLNNAHTQVDPKSYLDKWFKRAGKGPYTAHIHAAQIAKHSGFARLRQRTKEFPRLEESLKQALCSPPLAWAP
jgi:hypothetical protein